MSINKIGGNNTTIRKLEAGDVEALVSIWYRSICIAHNFLEKERLRELHQKMPEYLVVGNDDTWVACIDGQPVGFAIMDTKGGDCDGDDDDDEDDSVFNAAIQVMIETLMGDLPSIGALFVDPDMQGKGVGRILIEHVLEIQGKIYLEAYSNNTVAVDFYKHLGFKEVFRDVDDEYPRYKEFEYIGLYLSVSDYRKSASRKIGSQF
ncbi:GNAT family N-acetyltransferase [Paraburkholderia sp. Se-20369]|nr:GNAT family N-acetyltransferase [Paraburkholderia sp. Se-20369]